MQRVFVNFVLIPAALVGSVICFPACKSSLEGEYADPNKVEIVDDRWNDTDARISTEELLQSCLSRPWLVEFKASRGGADKKPRVLVGDFENRTDEHIDTKALFEAVRKELINSGKISFLDGDQRNTLLKEYAYQGSGVVRKDQAKGPGKQLSPDFFLFGSVSSIVSQEGGKKRVTYRVTMRLTDISTSEIVWEDNKLITKRFQRARVGG